ncbi:hypothetical protein ACH5RR_026876 [Cinchona calisaya]|uniref:Glycosyltransferase n=1 Tax=Cinchona calisaya TaxID=153742 RepID=A0ABD2Z500_9GENT
MSKENGPMKRRRPHAILVPTPGQGHINPMMKIAKLLHQRGFHITFVNTQSIHQRLLESQVSLKGLSTFQFLAIPDGLSDAVVVDVPAIVRSMENNLLAPFRELVMRINDNAASNIIPPITCIVSDGCLSFTLEVAEELSIPNVLLWTHGACGIMAYASFHQLVEKGLTPLKDSSFLTNGYLDTAIDWIPGMEGIRLRDLPTFIRTTDKEDIMVHFNIRIVERSHKASAIIVNTFDTLECEILDELKTMFPKLSTIGPLHLMENQPPEDDETSSFGSNLWREDGGYLEWLDSKESHSVLYVNFGTSTHMTANMLTELAWGLAKSKQNFLWIIRSDLVARDTINLPIEFKNEIKERGLIASWCKQEKVLNHPAIGGFLTHCGWNSTLESISAGVPMICWPALFEQTTNCWFCCNKWGVGVELGSELRRDNIENLVKELMLTEKGKKMKDKAMEWKRLAEDACLSSTGSSYINFERIVEEVLLCKTKDS